MAAEMRPQTEESATEVREWLASLDYVLEEQGPARAWQLLDALRKRLHEKGASPPFSANTPYVNTISPREQP